jgi:hypothetical protein
MGLPYLEQIHKATTPNNWKYIIIFFSRDLTKMIKIEE